MSRELLQQALDALEACTTEESPDQHELDAARETLTALREALAAPQPAPIGKVLSVAEMGIGYDRRMGDVIWWNKPPGPAMLYAAAPPAAPIDGFGGNLDSAFDAPAAPALGDMVMVPRDLLTVMMHNADRPGVIRSLLLKVPAAPAPVVPCEHRRAKYDITFTQGTCQDCAAKWTASQGWSAAPVVREPLTDEQLAKIAVEDEFLLYCDQDSFNEIARAIEQAHGIGGGNG